MIIWQNFSPSWRGRLEGRSPDRGRGASSLVPDCSGSCCSPAACRSDSKSHPFGETSKILLRFWVFLINGIFFAPSLPGVFSAQTVSSDYMQLFQRCEWSIQSRTLSSQKVLIFLQVLWLVMTAQIQSAPVQHSSQNHRETVTTSSGIAEGFLAPPPIFFLFLLSIFCLELSLKWDFRVLLL